MFKITRYNNRYCSFRPPMGTVCCCNEDGVPCCLCLFVSLVGHQSQDDADAPPPNDRATESRFSHRAYHARHFATLQRKRTARAVPTEPHAHVSNTASPHPTFPFLNVKTLQTNHHHNHNLLLSSPRPPVFYKDSRFTHVYPEMPSPNTTHFAVPPRAIGCRTNILY